MNDNNESRDLLISNIADYIYRIEKLEDYVFGNGSTGPGGFGEQLKAIDEKLDSIEKVLSNNIISLDDKFTKKIKETIEVTAELNKIIENITTQPKFNRKGMLKA